MPDLRDTVVQALTRALRGTGTHVDTLRALEGLDWQHAGRRPGGAPHSVLRLLRHMTFWQELYLERLAGRQVASPAHAEGGWPGADEPAGEGEWREAVERFAEGLTRARECVETLPLEEPLPNFEGRSRLETALFIAAHNSHHLGQIVLVRRLLGAWPPPGGGDTW